MSYDVYLLHASRENAESAYEALEDSEGGAPDAEAEAAIRSIVDELRALNPGFEVTGPDYELDESELAELEPEAAEAARELAEMWTIQLFDERMSTAMVELYSDHAVIMFSYGADDFARAVDETLRYVEVFRRHGYTAYDPQLDRVLTGDDRDRDEMLAVAVDVKEHVLDEITGERRPWWRRLFGG